MNFENPTACFRTWIVNNKEIINIVFYQNGEILSQTEKGFLSATIEHGITLDIKNIPEIENVKKSTKLNLERTDCFTYKSTFYIYAPLVNCTPTKEVLRDEDKFGKQQYINAFTVTITHEGELKTFTIYGASYTRSALTGLSIVSEELKQYLDSIGFNDISTHDTNKMVKNAESIIAILNKAQSPI